MEIKQDISLRNYNSFGIDVKAGLFVEIKSAEDLYQLVSTAEYRSNPSFILGGGNNILFTKDFEGLIIKNSIAGIKIIKEEGPDVFIEASAGEDWDQFVEYCAENKYWGIENLSLIPGTAGAAPIQNIGAYGTELTDIFEYLRGFDLITENEKTFTNDECRFSYRNSIFKKELKGSFIITSIVLKLSKVPIPNLRYSELKKTVGDGVVNIKQIRDVVCSIRRKKLPDPKFIGNAGSFFKNPVISILEYDNLKREYPDLPGFSSSTDNIKISAGWMIEQCGLKGYRKGNAGVYDKQALVFVNYGGATGQEILDLAEIVKEAVYNKFSIRLDTEVNIV